MAKPLFFVKNKVKDQSGAEVESWELVAFEDCPIMHAAWNPFSEVLICQSKNHKMNIEEVYTGVVDKKTRQPEKVNKNVDTWYRIVISDKEAVQGILDEYVINYSDQKWDFSYPLQAPQPISEEEYAEALDDSKS